MDFKELEEKYNLDFNKLAQILKKQHIILKLEHLNNIPLEWIPIIETSLGFMSPKKSIEKPKEIKQINNRLQNLQEFKKKQKEYQTLSDSQIARNKIDFSQFNKPKKKIKF